ncbi:MAG: phage shock protein operon transcriptional activator [Pseudomonadota bacterium]
MRQAPDNIIGGSLALTEALDHLSALAAIARPVLVIGERGTGKELAGQRLHFLSPRWDAPFIKINCAAMAESLLESELFGHEAGAFTGATRQHIGRFERADGGTLFLDEVGTMSLRLQEKLLRLIEYGEFERVGGSRTLGVDVRIVAATNADLPRMAQRDEFRADLLDRLSFDVVHMPPLRARTEDVLLLAEHFAVQLCAELGWALFPGFAGDVRTQLLSHRWPGNVRELKNVVERSIYRWGESEDAVGELVVDPFESPWAESDSDGEAGHAASTSSGNGAGAHDSAADVGHQTPPGAVEPVALRDAVDAFERRLLLRALAARDYHQGRTAEDLQLSYHQLRGLLRKHQLRSRASRS